MLFTTSYADVVAALPQIDPIQYGKTRNYIDGAVTRLSPYISRGLISTRQVGQAVLAKGFRPAEIKPFLQELAWRDYFQQVWIAKGDGISADLKQAQPGYTNTGISKVIVEANTGIAAIDEGITDLLNAGYMHNHVRMYVASLACNIAKSHWLQPAQWMYYYLLDADWSSNALSWQWVAGSFSNKQYVANQENINRYCYTRQRHTFLDTSYEQLARMETPAEMLAITSFTGATVLPATGAPTLNPALPTYVYNFYNLDSTWGTQADANRVLLLEPRFFERYPVCERTMAFVLSLAKNINGVQVYAGDFDAAFAGLDERQLHYKEHPTNAHYRGVEHKRDWLFESVTGYFPSFFQYWKRCEREMAQAGFWMN